MFLCEQYFNGFHESTQREINAEMQLSNEQSLRQMKRSAPRLFFLTSSFRKASAERVLRNAFFCHRNGDFRHQAALSEDSASEIQGPSPGKIAELCARSGVFILRSEQNAPRKIHRSRAGADRWPRPQKFHHGRARELPLSHLVVPA